MNKYKLTDQLLDTRSNIHKLERDGFDRRQIIDFMYKATQGVSQQERTKIIERLYDRKE